ncbi:MAG: alanine--tRNA ligase [Salinivirgaceae bacterium]|nr:alanine--tRNA ligase [Salinivirgaceae bacterium]
MNSKEIRNTFKEFFASKQHQIVSSAPMVVKGDPTLMFTNAGMNQFKDIFLGISPRKWPRVANSQKCLRVSGKHNDLEEVGHDTYHHTMFEMLGNWSFGDYFKEEAIAWAWELLTEVYKLPVDRLYATVFEGDESENLALDTEAENFWLKYLPRERVIHGNKHDNFWEMGATGPCGPCSEIHIDLRDDSEREKIPGRELVNQSNPQVIEIWNLVFMQYNRKADGSLELLPHKHVDTGMGFERLCMALQGKKSNYDTDVFQPIIKAIGKLCGCEYGKSEQVDVAMRVVADHLRTIAFSITDGQLPSNAKAGYVIRRILRRAVRYGYTFLGQRNSFMYKLLPALIDNMGDAYPELGLQKNLVEKVMKEEEDAFLRTLETGIKLLDKVMAETKAAGKTQITGVEAFTLYDTFGFPLDLTELILRENGLTVNQEEFDAEMQKQKDRARNAASIETGDWVELKEGESEFVGYDVLDVDVEVLRYRKIKQKNKELFQIVLNRTPFYAEMGGQLGDTGYLESEDGRIDIIDTKKENNLSVHYAEKMPADPTVSFRAVVDTEKREQTTCNHTATHLLHYALRQVLGTHVEQKGSLVSPNSLRFDFSHFQKVTDEELRQVEIIANKLVREDLPLDEARNMPIDQAKAMGAMALFGEKYGDSVRVIKYGPSVELCGGTHVASTGHIGSIRILAESSVAAGVRRIEAVTAAKADEVFYASQDIHRNIKALFNNTPNLEQTIRKALDENVELKKQIEEFMAEKAKAVKDEILAKAEIKNGVKLVVLKGIYPADFVKNVAFQIRGQEKNATAFIAATVDTEKPLITVALSDDLVVAGKNATNMIRSVAKEIQGGGGGQPFFATAGGKNASGLETALKMLVESI